MNRIVILAGTLLVLLPNYCLAGAQSQASQNSQNSSPWVLAATEVRPEQSPACDGKHQGEACGCDKSVPPKCGECVVRDGVALDCAYDR